jgi:hypothetical protein
MVELIRDKLGDYAMIRIDFNKAYSLSTARRLARPLEELGVRNWEDPVATIENMRELRRHCSIPLSTHNIDIARAMDLEVPDAFVGNPTVHGGIGRMVRFVGACEHAGIDYWCYSGDTGIGSAAYLHLCAALGWIREPNQSLFRMLPTDVIEEGPFSPRANVVRVPEGPGSASPCRGNAWPPVTGTSPRTDLATNTTTPRTREPIAGCRSARDEGSKPETARDGWTGKDRMLQSRQTGRRGGRENGAIHKNP